MSNYIYKTNAPAVVAAVLAWEAKRKEWDVQRAKLGQIFGGAASPMRSGNRSYVGGVKLSESRELDVHWCRPDQHGYRALRSSAKPAKGTPKEARTVQVAEHERLSTLRKENCPASIDMDEAWEAIGLNLGVRLEDGNEKIECAA